MGLLNRNVTLSAATSAVIASTPVANPDGSNRYWVKTLMVSVVTGAAGKYRIEDTGSTPRIFARGDTATAAFDVWPWAGHGKVTQNAAKLRLIQTGTAVIHVEAQYSDMAHDPTSEWQS